jgi:rod shape determining protein RodA
MIEVAHSRPVPPRRRTAHHVGALVRGLDWLLVGAVIALCAYGVWVIHATTRDDVPGDPTYYVVRQGAAIAIGAVLFILALLVDPDVYRRYKQPLYAVTLALLAFVFLAGTVVRGSRRWIDLAFFRFQPSEFGKLLIVLVLSAFLADRARRMDEWRTPLTAIALAAPATFLVFVQPDIGSGLVYLAALGAVLFVAGIRWLHLAVLGTLTVLGVLAVLWWLPSVGVQVLKPYQQERLTGFTNPDVDPQGATYNARQAITAVGAGGLDGRGVEGATQTNLNYLPEHATDFAFASLAEQRGFLGVMFLLLLYLLVVWRGLKTVTIARDAFSAIVAAGIVAAFLVQIFVNVGMNIGIAPITGIPLPFVSVGGSSVVANLAALGVLQAIHARGHIRR